MNKNVEVVAPDVRVAEIAARAEAATEGPWEVDDNRPFSRDLQGIFATDLKRYVLKIDYDEQPENRSDAEFIAHARDDIPFLLSEVRRLRSVVEDAERAAGERESRLVIAAAREALLAAADAFPGSLPMIMTERDWLRQRAATYQAGADHE